MQNERDPLQDWINQWWPVAPMYSPGELDTYVSHALQEERARMVKVLEEFLETIEHNEMGDAVPVEQIQTFFSDVIRRLKHL